MLGILLANSNLKDLRGTAPSNLKDLDNNPRSLPAVSLGAALVVNSLTQAFRWNSPAVFLATATD
jgi:hypothetical protein